MMFKKSKATKVQSALRQIQREYPQHEGTCRAIDEFLSSARPGTLNRLYDIVTGTQSKAEALEYVGQPFAVTR